MGVPFSNSAVLRVRVRIRFSNSVVLKIFPYPCVLFDERCYLMDNEWLSHTFSNM